MEREQVKAFLAKPEQKFHRREIEKKRKAMLSENRLQRAGDLSQNQHSTEISRDLHPAESASFKGGQLNSLFLQNAIKRKHEHYKPTFKFLQALSRRGGSADETKALTLYESKTIPGYKCKIYEILLQQSAESCHYCQGKAPNLLSKYSSTLEYNVKVVNDIMYNEKMRLVAVFKDYLIYDDLTEFLKRPYTLSESVLRLNKIFEFYESYSQVFPNYIDLPEKEFMYKNIERK